MRTLSRLLLCGLVLLAGSVAQAGYPTYFYPTYYVPTVYPSEVHYHNHYNRITVFQDTPTYTVGQGAPYVAPAAQESPCDAKIKAMQAAFDAKFALLEERAKASAAPAAPPVPQAAPQPVKPTPEPAASPAKPGPVLGGVCAACHDGRQAEKKGGGVVLTKGGRPVAEWNPELIGKALAYVSKGHCPKGDGAKLTQPEYNAFVQELVDLSKQ